MPRTMSTAGITVNDGNDISSYASDNLLFIDNSSDLDAQLMIFNTMGQEVYSERISEFRGSIDISSLPSGMYILKLLSSGAVIHTNKFTID